MVGKPDAEPRTEPRPIVVGLVGGECSGKTTLARALVAEFDGIHVREKLRDFVDEHARPPRKDEQYQLMLDQETAEAGAVLDAVSLRKRLVVGDPAAFMTAIYSIAYYNDPSLLDHAVEHLVTYDALVWCDVAIPWEADGAQRDGPIERDRVDAVIAATLRDRSISAQHVAGGVDLRVEQVRDMIGQCS